MNRRGAALVLALVLLAALLLLGLPFLYSQAASLSGTRSFADSRQAQIGRDSAENMAAGMAAYALTPAFAATRPIDPASGFGGDPSAADSDLCRLAADSPDTGPVLDKLKPAVVRLDEGNDRNADDDDGAISLRPEGLGLGFNDPPAPGATKQRTYLGAVVTDESGKLDPNLMGPQQWQALLAACGIVDWDDKDLYDPPAVSGYSEDDDELGQLAQTLAGVRFAQPSRRITRLEQLLTADPQKAQAGGPWTKLRYPLTRAELERLRPYLTLHVPRQGRGGLIDLGTVARVDVLVNPVSGFKRTTLWVDAPAEESEPLLALGTLLSGEDTVAATGAHQIAVINANSETGQAEHVVLGKSFFVPGADTLAQAGGALAIEAPAALNVHQLAPSTRQARGIIAPLPKPIATVGSPPTTIDAEVRTIGGTGGLGRYGYPSGSPKRTLFDDTSPFVAAAGLPDPYLKLGGNLEFPPLSLVSGGVFTIDAAATVTDVLGRQTAESARRDVVQAVPQEYLLERRWDTQGQMHALIAQRYGSRVEAWPVAYRRRDHDASAKQVLPDDHDEAIAAERAAIATDTAIVARTQPDPASIPAMMSATRPDELYLQHVQLDWRVTFGAAGKLNDADVLSATARQWVWHNNSINILDFAAAPNDPPRAPLNPAASAPSLRPDGYHITATGELGYRLHGTTAPPAGGVLDNAGLFVERRSTAEGTPTTHEMDARHISLWFKPEADWDGARVYPILETRVPAAGLMQEPGAATPTTSDSENYLGVFYDDRNEMLVLTTAPPSIPHTHDTSPLAGAGLASFGLDDPTTVAIDERSDGTLASGPLAVLFPSEPAPPAGAGFTSDLWQANRVLHCYKTPRGTDPSHFRRGQWYHLQIALASDRPEGVDIILDGIVGRDAARVSPSNPTPQKLGDHCVLPALALQNDLPAAADASKLRLANIPVKAPFGLPVSALLPPRGFVRIDDEYIRYDSLGTDQLVGCQRGLRQNTFVTNAADPGVNFPNTQGHTAGTLVVPGGYRLGLDQGRIYRGGALTDQPVPVGLDPAQQYRVAAGLDFTRVPKDPVSGNYTLTATADIPLIGVNASVFPVTGGVVQIGYGSPQYRFYTTRSGNVLTGVQTIQGWTVVPDPGNGNGTRSAPATLTWSSIPNPPPKVTLLSISAVNSAGAPAGSSPMQAGRYAQSPLGAPFLLQLSDPTTARIEWFKYHFILNDNTAAPATPRAFFLNLDGYPYVPDGTVSGRGIARTDFEAKTGTLLAVGGSTFPVNSAIAPVQTEVGNHGHWVATGDTVTLLPKVLGPGVADLPFQAGIRFGASDGYPTSGVPPVDPAADSKNEYFTFVDPLDPVVTGGDWNTPINGVEYDILCGDCWGGPDLSPDNSDGSRTAVDEPRGYLPRLDLLAGGDPGRLGATSDATVWIGSTDPLAPMPSFSDCTIDGLCAGGLARGSLAGRFDDHDFNTGQPARTNTASPGIIRFLTSAGEKTVIGTGMTDLPIVVEANLPIFEQGLGLMGLVEIDGEVFAYERVPDADAAQLTTVMSALEPKAPTGTPPVSPPWQPGEIAGNSRFAKLIARGLLDLDAPGQTWQAHTILPASGRRALLPAKRLPIGPVLQLQGDPANYGGWFLLNDSTPKAGGGWQPKILYAPAALFCKLDGDPANEELLQLIGPRHHLNPPANDPLADYYATAPWLRGLYATSEVPWAGTEPNALVIGWWPRYASALPPTVTLTKEHFRSRTYAWVGFPFSLYGSYFDPAYLANLPTPFASMSLADVRIAAGSLFPDGGTDFFKVEARALANEAQWSGSPPSDAGSMDWSLQTPASLNGGGDAGDAFKTANDLAHCFSDGGSPAKARAVDGAELRVSWRYNALAPDLAGVANATNRSPAISSARLRCLAPVRVLATENAR